MGSKDRKEAKRAAVVARISEMQSSIGPLSTMWDERTLDILIVILGIGRVEIDE